MLFDGEEGPDASQVKHGHAPRGEETGDGDPDQAPWLATGGTRAC